MSLFIMTSWPLKQNIKLTSKGVALYNFQGNKAAPFLPWTTVSAEKRHGYS